MPPATMGRSRADVVVEPLDAVCLPGALLESLTAQPDPAWLDSAAFDETHGRYSVLACRPIDVLTLRDGTLTSERTGILADGGGSNEDFWAALGEAFAWVQADDDDDLDFGPGWIGYVGYEVGRRVERLPGRAVRDTHLPDLRLAFYDAALVYDAVRTSWSLAYLQFDHPPQGAGEAAQVLRTMLRRAAADPIDAGPIRSEHADATARPAVEARSAFTRDQYLRAVARCADYIAAGDIFQVNFSHRLTTDGGDRAVDIYRALRRRNPASYAAYLSFDCDGAPCAILSSSPELFLTVRNGHVVTRPIKGTRPRTGEANVDARAAAELLASGKDNAELAMIIDLLRNDLGRVCDYSTVRVTNPRRLETHPTVFHLVGTVEGDLCDDVGPAQLLRATFPGGSITGAPKIRSMQIIDELEPTARGVYTGCIGHVGVTGQATWNIAIRTIVCDGPVVHIQVGGGIVADSDPEAEYQETLDKARALLEAIAEARALVGATPAGDTVAP